MKKLVFCIIILLTVTCAVFGEGIKLRSGKASYLRYELVDLYCEYTGPMLDINGASDRVRAAAVCTAKVFCDNRQVTTVGETDSITFSYNPALKRWTGLWPIPWNPRLGNYRAVIYFQSGAKKFAGTVGFSVIKRVPLPLPKGFCAMDIEPGDSIITRVPGMGGKSVKIWENYVLWAKFMGASALWHCVGQSQIWNSFKPDDFPWDKITLSQISQLGAECHKYDIKYGAWITSFVVLGNRKDLSPYKQSTAYERSTGHAQAHDIRLHPRHEKEAGPH